MARDNDGDRVAIVRHAYGAKSLGAADGAGNVGVGTRLAVGDRYQGLPARPLKICAEQIEGKSELAALAGEIFFQFMDVVLHRTWRWLELHAFARGALVLGTLALGPLTLGAKVAGVGANRLLPLQARVKLQSHQTLVGRGQKQRPYR